MTLPADQVSVIRGYSARKAGRQILLVLFSLAAHTKACEEDFTDDFPVFAGRGQGGGVAKRSPPRSG